MPATITIDLDAVAHSPLEDAQGLLCGCFMTSLGLVFLTHLGFLTGQTAGMALIISYLTGWSFGAVFFIVNLPFYVFAYARFGLEFTLKSLFCVTAVSVLSDLLARFIILESVDPLVGTLVFGITVGFGLLACIRHNGSLGGMSVLALYVQDRTGFKAGYFQLVIDAALFAIAVFIFPASVVAY